MELLINELQKNGVIILDFGSQYTQLIARRVRELNVYSEILPSNTHLSQIVEREPSSIILSGGPSSVFGDEAPSFDKKIFDPLKTWLGFDQRTSQLTALKSQTAPLLTWQQWHLARKQ